MKSMEKQEEKKMEKLHVSSATLHTVSAESAEILAGIKERIAFIRITEARMSGVTASQVLDEVLRGVTVPVRL